MKPNVLLLNADGQPLSTLPLSTISWQNAIKAMFADKVHVIKTYDYEVIRSASLEIPFPSIIMLNKYHRQPDRARFCRKNVYLRDHYQCQYCGDEFNYLELTMDHVIPKSKGGRLHWTNVVTACGPCNVKKGNKTSMKPIKEPIIPSWHLINNANKRHSITIPDISWQDYVQWPEDKLIIQS